MADSCQVVTACMLGQQMYQPLESENIRWVMSDIYIAKGAAGVASVDGRQGATGRPKVAKPKPAKASVHGDDEWLCIQ